MGIAIQITCCHCGKTVTKYGKIRRKYCSTKCGQAARLDVWSKYPGIATATVGAIGEYRVSIDLLAKGMEVFKAVSASCSCDLVVVLKGKLLRVEVKTGYQTKAGALMCPKPLPHQIHDVLAVVVGADIVYKPPIEEWL